MMMAGSGPEVWRATVRDELPNIVTRMNVYLGGDDIANTKSIVTNLGRGGILPYWFSQLEDTGTLPNADGKTIGSILEMLMCADIERNVLAGEPCVPLVINPAKGVDIPVLDLGVKSPSENWCTSEPFTSAYERLLGTEFDVVAIITNYQTAKKRTPLRLKIIHQGYFQASQVADKNLCIKATSLRNSLPDVGEANCKKGLRFLAHAIQSNWLGASLAKIIGDFPSTDAVTKTIRAVVADGNSKIAKGASHISQEDILAVENLLKKTPLLEAIINEADSWVNQNSPELALIPNGFYWNKFLTSPLDGALGVSFALQWRYNFGVYFRGANA